jgi:hypothetical protein
VGGYLRFEHGRIDAQADRLGGLIDEILGEHIIQMKFSER